MDLQFLPYIVVTNPHIKRVYDSYQHAFETLHNLPQVKTVEQNAEFTVLLKRLVDEHGQSPPLAACLPQLEHYTVSHTASDKLFAYLHHLDRLNGASMSAAIIKLKYLCCITTATCIHLLCSSSVPASWPTDGLQRTHAPADQKLPLTSVHQHDIAFKLWQLQYFELMQLALINAQRGLHIIQHASSMLLIMYTCCCSPNA